MTDPTPDTTIRQIDEDASPAETVTLNNALDMQIELGALIPAVDGLIRVSRDAEKRPTDQAIRADLIRRLRDISGLLSYMDVLTDEVLDTLGALPPVEAVVTIVEQAEVAHANG